MATGIPPRYGKGTIRSCRSKPGQYAYHLDTITSTQMLLNGQADLAFVSNNYSTQLNDATLFHYPEPIHHYTDFGASIWDFKKIPGGLATSSTDAFFNFNIDTGGPRNYIGSGTWDRLWHPDRFFSDTHVRKGFNYAFNWQEYINEAYSGVAVQRTGPIIKPLIGYSASQPSSHIARPWL